MPPFTDELPMKVAACFRPPAPFTANLQEAATPELGSPASVGCSGSLEGAFADRSHTQGRRS